MPVEYMSRMPRVSCGWNSGHTAGWKKIWKWPCSPLSSISLFNLSSHSTSMLNLSLNLVQVAGTNLHFQERKCVQKQA